jgi:hypothetical protein
MLFFDGGLALIAFAVWVFCIIDVITTPEGDCRNLPKLLWLLIVVILPDVGSIAWLVAGRNWNTGARNLAYKGDAGATPARTRPGRANSNRPSNPDDDEEFLAGLRARAEEQRRRARETERRDDPPAPPS